MHINIPFILTRSRPVKLNMNILTHFYVPKSPDSRRWKQVISVPALVHYPRSACTLQIALKTIAFQIRDCQIRPSGRDGFI